MAGIGIDLVCAAAAILVGPRPLWIAVFLLGSALIVYAVVVGEPESHDPRAIGAEGGKGDGDVRGNVFGDNATVQITKQESMAASTGARTLLRTSPVELCEIYQVNTEIHAERLAKDYLGGRLEIDCTVRNVSKGGQIQRSSR